MANISFFVFNFNLKSQKEVWFLLGHPVSWILSDFVNIFFANYLSPISPISVEELKSTIPGLCLLVFLFWFPQKKTDIFTTFLLFWDIPNI